MLLIGDKRFSTNSGNPRVYGRGAFETRRPVRLDVRKIPASMVRKIWSSSLIGIVSTFTIISVLHVLICRDSVPCYK
ncbi:hypothetical protein X798_02257 [Onchocerca flexuosa]|uniref:Transmembrane protein n=2 Tax=Onchocerca flexuosa TaxID=387005 RepID=A0A183I0I6_9BILA|nr:hypothetical protein X798_02257 [Onchocerca flexuosa]VDP13271.1 unnamed protein product [Onchocerca flexuosa]